MSTWKLRFRKAAVLLVATVVALVLVVLGALTLVLSTNGGSRWAINQVVERLNRQVATRLDVGSIEGTLLRGLSLGNLHFENIAIAIEIGQTSAVWNPYTLLSGTFYSPSLAIEDAVVRIKPPQSQPVQPRAALSLNLPALPVAVEVEALSLRGLEIHQGSQWFEIQQLSAAARMSGQTLSLESLDMEFQPLALNGDLNATFSGPVPVVADLNWHYGGLAAPLDSISGHLNASGNLERLVVANQLLTPVDLATDGSLDTGLGSHAFRLDLTHQADSLVLPWPQLEAMLLDEVTLETRGPISALELTLFTGLNTDYAPSLRVEASAVLTGQQITIESIHVASPSGELSGNAVYGWGDNSGGSINYRLRESDLSTYLNVPLPMAVTDLESSGLLTFSTINNSLQGLLNLAEISGSFGEYPFSGSGRIELQEDTWRFDQMQLFTASNRLLFTGVLGETLNLDWNLLAPEANQFIPELSGNLSATGNLAGTTENPEVISRLTAENLSYRDLQVGNLTADLQLQDHRINALVSAQNAIAANQPIQSLTLDLQGTESNHSLSLEAVAEAGSLSASISGEFTDLATLEWQGTLQSVQVDSPLGAWSTIAASALGFADRAFDVSETCWQQQQTSLCVSASLDFSPGGDRLLADARLRGYPLTVLNHDDNHTASPALTLTSLPQLPQNVTLTGTANADIRAAIDADSNLGLEWRIEPDNLGLRLIPVPSDDLTVDENGSPIDRSRLYELGNTLFEGSLNSGTWSLSASTRVIREVSAESTIPLDGSIEADLTIDQDGRLEGAARANLDDIGWLSALVPDLTDVQGQLEGELLVGGTMDAPQISSDVQLSDGRFSLLPLGITVTDTQVQITSPDFDSLEITARASSGTGELRLNGRVNQPFSADRELQATLAGTDFELSDNEQLRTTLSPQIELQANREQIGFSGSLAIPVLALELTTLPESAVDVSRDAVVVSYPPDQPELARSIASEQSTLFNIPVVADLQIALGDEISFRGFGLDTRLTGNLDVQQHANGTNLTYGSLEVTEGSFAMYGQSLRIDQGELLFFGAYDNPALDIRAVREVEGITAGVLMNGTLRNIQSQLFSTPALADSDIIAILATGKPFSEVGEQDSDAMVGAIASLGLNRSQGLTNQVRDRLGLDTLAITNTGDINNAALTIGKYLTPDLFIRYGVGLFDRQSKLALDYTLTDRITLQAESGEFQSVDVIYKVER